MQWLQPTVQGTVPEGRGVHTVTVVGDQLVMYGGSSDFRDMQCHKFYNDLHTVHTGECCECFTYIFEQLTELVRS